MQRKLPKKVLFVLLPIIIVSSISIGLLTNNFIVLSRIYYKVNYEIVLPNSEDVIETAETFDFLRYVKYHNPDGEIFNLSKFNYNYIDREYIDHLRHKIDRDKRKFHLLPYYSHILYYTFNATEISKLCFSYNNYSIFNATYENGDEIYIGEYNTHTKNYYGNWYVNFSLIPSVISQSSTLLLNNTILVKMILEYDYVYGNVGAEYINIEQYMVFNSNLQIIFVYIPLIQMIVA